jgi:hypothetical protein
MSEVDVVTPAAGLVHDRLTAAIAVKEQLTTSGYPDVAV